MEPGTFTIMHLDLASLDSVRDFVVQVRQLGRTLDALVCNAAVWYPQDKEPRITVDGYEEAVQVNHLGHFLLCNLLLGDLPEGSGRILFIGTETANDGLAGFVPPRADLGKLEGMARGMNYTIDGKEFEPTKSYKDSKVCNAVIMREMNKRFGQERGITVHAMFPGCIAESPLFRQKRGWFRKVFPEFQKKITKQFVPENIAGQRVADCVADADKAVGGAYWKWNAAAGQQANRDGFEKQKTAAANVVKIPAEALDEVLAEGIWDLSAALVGLGIAPSIKFEDNDALEPEERERKQKMELKSTFVREDMTRARGLLEQLRTAPEALADREFATELSDALSGDAAEGLDTVYYWGRRQHPPMIKIYDDETNYRMELSAPRARADPKVGEILLTGLRAALKDAGVNTEMSPEISFEGKIPEKDSDASVDGEVKVGAGFPDTSDTLAMAKEMIGGELLGQDSREDSDIISREMVMEWTKQMEEASKPPTGIDAEIFGERDSLKRLIFESVSQGAITN
jgi:protochlorophyllide reductase